jgi:pilus assembly protein Flp/PilA
VFLGNYSGNFLDAVQVSWFFAGSDAHVKAAKVNSSYLETVFHFYFNLELTMNSIKKFILEEDGAAAVEYGLLTALIAAVIIVAVQTLGGRICGMFNGLSIALKNSAKYSWTAC